MADVVFLGSYTPLEDRHLEQLWEIAFQIHQVQILQFLYCQRSRRFLKNEKKNNFINFTQTVSFHLDFTIMKVGGSLLSLICGGDWSKHPSNSQTLGKTHLQLCGLQLACEPSSLYFTSLVMAARSLIGFGTCTRSLEYWSLWLQICAIFHCMKPHSLCQCLKSVAAVVSIKQFKEMLFCL